MHTNEAPFITGQRVTRRFDGAAGTVETVTPWDSETGDWAIAVRLDTDGEVWSGTEVAWKATPRATTTNTRTQYAIVYRGQLDQSMTFGTRVDVDAYVATAVEHGQSAADYAVVHRTVTYGDWAPTTAAPATVAAHREATSPAAMRRALRANR